MYENWLLTIWFIKKVARDLALTLYDDFEFKFISLPRVVYALAVMCVIVSWVGDQFFGLHYSNFQSLITWAISAAGAYAVKKIAERGNTPPSQKDSTQ